MKKIATKRMLEGKSNALHDLPQWIRTLQGCKKVVEETSESKDMSKDILDELSFDIERNEV